MSNLDFNSSCWQVPLDKDSRYLKDFTVNEHVYEFFVSPFETKTSLAGPERALESVFRN